MPECSNPLYPCAMTGAVACLAAFEGITVVIHGSSGCYFYPATLLHASLSGTFILEREVIFGSEERLTEVIREASRTGKQVAVVTTCVPSVLGEDIRAMLSDYHIILIDSPGFSGSFADGYRNALSVLAPSVDPGSAGITIDGVSLFDPFWQGNIQEVSRLLATAGIPIAAVLCADKFSRIRNCSPFRITTDADLESCIGTSLGGTLGIDALRATFRRIGDEIGRSDAGAVLAEIDRREEQIIRVCDKYLRRFDPPRTVIFSGFSYATFAAHTLKKYLDAEICFIGCRTDIRGGCTFPIEEVTSLTDVQELIRNHHPDLVLGSSFEKSISGDAAFVGITPPLRGSIRLASRPLAGIEGTLFLMEEILNACRDRVSDAR